jgi:hypothetical protein
VERRDEAKMNSPGTAVKVVKTDVTLSNKWYISVREMEAKTKNIPKALTEIKPLKCKRLIEEAEVSCNVETSTNKNNAMNNK